MTDTLKDESLLGGGICHIRAVSQYEVHSNLVLACVSNIV